jgi:hypothetical protein
MGDDIHMRLQVDVGCHRRADRVGAASDARAAVDRVDLHDRGVGVVQGRRRFDVLGVEGPGKPEVRKLG